MFQRTLKLAATCAFLLSTALFAGTESPARTAIEAGQSQKAIELINKIDLKGAEDYYLLGKAQLALGNKIEAQKAWQKAIEQNKTAGLKWSFLFPPKKSLSGAEKKALYNDFMASYKKLAAAVISAKKDNSKTANQLADRLDNTANKNTALANASGEKIKDRVNTKSNKKKVTKKDSNKKGGSKIALYVILAIVVLVILLAIFGKSSPSEEEYRDAEFGTNRYSVDHNSDHFTAGSFWADGYYYHNQNDYYRRNGQYYSNAMYLDNYDRWGRGQGRDLSRDEDLLREIEERQDLREDAAEASYQAEEARLDADKEDQNIEEIEESIEALEEEPDFADDEPAEEPDFADDEPAEEEPSFEDDEPSFEDDEETKED